jgi:hypothetical protein
VAEFSDISFLLPLVLYGRLSDSTFQRLARFNRENEALFVNFFDADKEEIAMTEKLQNTMIKLDNQSILKDDFEK